ncbi:MAG TPA: response regulator [Candidatus Hydrogenedentes bacterium]|nr:response regulator [Candidatus Hydrogenedentota bacterium]HNT89707.1 response regulator [Candidatus Hydrogenedentota bacterium]
MKHILAVDDDVGLLDLLGKALAPRGYALSAAHRVGGVLEKVREVKPDYLLLDVMLPDGAGYQVARAVRGDARLNHMPILFISTLNDGPEVAHAMKQGGDAYLTKPFTLEQLLDRLRSLDALTDRLSAPDAKTGLLHVEAITREIDRRILRHESYALCYFTIRNFPAYQSVRPPADCERVIAWAASLLREQARDLALRDTRLAYVGGGHFLVLVHPDEDRKYCKAVNALFDDGVKQFYRSFEVEQGYTVNTPAQGVYEGARLMRLHIVILRSDEHDFKSSHEVLKAFQRAVESPDEEKTQAVFRYYQKYKW